ncbi:MAG: acyl-ACP--UDP-N-acetylglucosamine O-acyltransferase [bacterium]
MGLRCEVGPFCRFEGRVAVGGGCRFGTGTIVGSEPMDRSYQGEASCVVIGEKNVFFEYVTVHRACGEEMVTLIGDGNYIMNYVHVAHNCRIGNNCVLANGVQLGGYSKVDDGANLGGLTGVHQFCRIGKLAMVGAHSYVNRDIPPFVLAAGNPCRVRGLNLVGLRRAGMAQEEVEVIAELFRILYRSGLNLSQALKQIEREMLGGVADKAVEDFLEFCYNSRRGIELRTGPERATDDV